MPLSKLDGTEYQSSFIIGSHSNGSKLNTNWTLLKTIIDAAINFINSIFNDNGTIKDGKVVAASIANGAVGKVKLDDEVNNLLTKASTALQSSDYVTTDGAQQIFGVKEFENINCSFFSPKIATQEVGPTTTFISFVGNLTELISTAACTIKNLTTVSGTVSLATEFKVINSSNYNITFLQNNSSGNIIINGDGTSVVLLPGDFARFILLKSGNTSKWVFDKKITISASGIPSNQTAATTTVGQSN